MSEHLVPPVGPCFPDLRGKSVLITGGGTGIGQAICLRLATEGMNVMLCGLEQEPLSKTCEMIRQRGAKAWSRQVDLSSRSEVEALWDAVIQEQSPPDLLIHNAAWMTEDKPTVSWSLDDWNRVFAIGADTAFYLSTRCLEQMLQKRSGNIIFMSSAGGIRAQNQMAPYDASKAAINSLARTLGIEYSNRGIRVNAVCPGPILPRWNDQAEVPLGELEHKLVPMGRCGVGQEVAALVAFLASNQASYITGQAICVDGGSSVQLSPRGMFL